MSATASLCRADIPVCWLAELSSSASGDWSPSRRSGALARRAGGKVAESREARLESLRHEVRTGNFGFRV